MRPVVIDRVVWSVGLSVDRSVTLVSPAKMAELIQIPFRLLARMGPRNRVGWGPDAAMERGYFEANGRPIVKYRVALP